MRTSRRSKSDFWREELLEEVAPASPSPPAGRLVKAGSIGNDLHRFIAQDFASRRDLDALLPGRMSPASCATSPGRMSPIHPLMGGPSGRLSPVMMMPGRTGSTSTSPARLCRKGPAPSDGESRDADAPGLGGPSRPS